MQWTTVYGDRYQTLRGSVGGLPAWGRSIVLIAALPGIILAGLSIAALLVSLLLLFLLAAPAYIFLMRLTGARGEGGSVDQVSNRPPAAGVRRVDVTVLE